MKRPHRLSSVCVIGLGYIGLPTAAMFASRKINVIGVDINPQVVEIINQGKIHIVEPELDMIVHAAVTEGYLRATGTPEKADVFIVAVPTPLRDNHAPDIGYVYAAAESLAPMLEPGNTVILESTSPVGTTEQLAGWLAKMRPDLRFPDGHSPHADCDVHIVYCPERVLPGQVVHELVSNDRIIGGLSEACSQQAIAAYRTFVQGQMLVTHARTAEMSKLTENAYRDVNIAFANELSVLCDSLNINVWELIRLANHHPRVNILQPGCGVGGHCIAVDPWFIVDRSPEQARLIRTARVVNDHKPHWVIEQVEKAINHLVEQGRKETDITVAILGLAFKPNIDDLRESPALEIAENLQRKRHARFLFVEPNIEHLPISLGNAAPSCLAEAVQTADIVALLVAHREFYSLTLEPDKHLIIDAAGLLASKTHQAIA